MTSNVQYFAKLLAIELDWPIRARRSRNNIHRIEDGLRTIDLELLPLVTATDSGLTE